MVLGAPGVVVTAPPQCLRVQRRVQKSASYKSIKNNLYISIGYWMIVVELGGIEPPTS